MLVLNLACNWINSCLKNSVGARLAIAAGSRDSTLGEDTSDASLYQVCFRA